MTYTKNTKKRARRLRTKGESIPFIAKYLNISKSTASLWVKDVPLPQNLQELLKNNSVIGYKKGLEMLKAKRILQDQHDQKESSDLINNLPITGRDFLKLCAALIFWCEGSKRQLSSVGFTNSDPNLIKTFLYCLRNGFNIEEKKLRALLHLHLYHEEKQQLLFWSKITGIPLQQFSKSYRKPNTTIRQRVDYQGCIALRYYDAPVARKLNAIYHTFAKSIGP